MFSAMNCRKILYTHAKYIFLFLLKSLISAKEFVTKYLMVPDDKQKCIWKVSKNTERTSMLNMTVKLNIQCYKLTNAISLQNNNT